MKVIGVQFDITWEAPAANYDAVSDLLESAAVCPGSLIVLPEMFATGFSMNSQLTAGFQAQTHEFIAAVARKYESFVCGGLVTTDSDGLTRNSALLLGVDGETLETFPKLHPFTLLGEDKAYAPGAESKVARVGDFCFSALVCYDLRFPESFRAGVTKGAELFAVIANWPTARAEHWAALLRARAIENQAYVIGVNRCGADPNCSYAGGSTIIDPQGNILVTGDDATQIISADIDVKSLREYREEFPGLKDI